MRGTLSVLSSHAMLFHIRRNLRSLFHFIDITVNSWFSSFQVVLLDRLCRSQVHILLITIYFYCLFFDPVPNMKLIHMVFTVSQSANYVTFFLSFWKMTSKKQVRCHLLDLQRLCIAFLQNYWFLSHFYPSLFDSNFLGRACVTHWRELSLVYYKQSRWVGMVCLSLRSWRYCVVVEWDLAAKPSRAA